MSMHVPEGGRLVGGHVLASTAANGNNGAFNLDSPEPGWRLWIIASDGTDDPDLAAEHGVWEHVSVHAYKPESGERARQAARLVARGQPAPPVQMRTPSWREMAFIKDTFWDGEDVVVQYHPRRSEYVNNHPHTLHLWRPMSASLPTPPALFVGTLSGGPA